MSLLDNKDLELLRTINKELKERKNLYSEIEVKLLILQFISSEKPVSQFEDWWEQNKKK